MTGSRGSSAADAPRRAGFSLMELIVSISILAVLAGTLVPVVARKLAAARDARRLSDMKRVVDAVESHLLDQGSLPDGDAESGTGGYDTTLDDTFLSTLLTNRSLRERVSDPVNDATYHYEYQHYAAGTSGFTSDFYVVGVKNFETTGYAHVRGYWKGVNHDWTDDFAYCTGGVSR